LVALVTNRRLTTLAKECFRSCVPADSSRVNGKKSVCAIEVGGAYTYERKKDEKEIFTIKDVRHIEYRQEQVFEIYLVHGGSDGVIRWMNFSEYLRKRKDKHKKQVVFEGASFYGLYAA
jgi:hypothetical protein